MGPEKFEAHMFTFSDYIIRNIICLINMYLINGTLEKLFCEREHDYQLKPLKLELFTRFNPFKHLVCMIF